MRYVTKRPTGLERGRMMGMVKISGVTVDPSMNSEREGIDYIEIPIYSEEPDESGEYQIIGYVRDTN